jgi:hypothetical protein
MKTHVTRALAALPHRKRTTGGTGPSTDPVRVLRFHRAICCHFFYVKLNGIIGSDSSSLIGRPNVQPSVASMPTQVRASRIIAEFQQAQAELVGKAVILTNGVAGTVEELWLDELHGLRMSIRSHSGDWPVSTIKFVQKT